MNADNEIDLCQWSMGPLDAAKWPEDMWKDDEDMFNRGMAELIAKFDEQILFPFITFPRTPLTHYEGIAV